MRSSRNTTGQNVTSRQMTQRVTIERPKALDDRELLGGVEGNLTNRDNWETVATRFCEIITTGSGESGSLEQVTSTSTHRVTFRWDAVTRLIDPRYRLRWGSRLLNIGGVTEINRWMVQAYCQEQVT